VYRSTAREIPNTRTAVIVTIRLMSIGRWAAREMR
jgi:hypothetical protein